MRDESINAIEKAEKDGTKGSSNCSQLS